MRTKWNGQNILLHVCTRLPIPLLLSIYLGLLVCITGFVAWGIPYSWLNTAVIRFGADARENVLRTIAEELLSSWNVMYQQIMQQRLHWDVENQPMDAFAESERLSRLFYPVLVENPTITATPVVTLHGDHAHFGVLHPHPVYGWAMDRQNQTHRWLEKWNSWQFGLTGEVIQWLPVMTPDELAMSSAILKTTPEQPLMWFGWRNPQPLQFGYLFGVQVGLFAPGTQKLTGRAGLMVSTSNLHQFVLGVVDQQPVTHGGRLVLYDTEGFVVVATHGKFDKNERIPLLNIGDPDLEAAALLMQQASQGWCPQLNRGATFSIPYLLLSRMIEDPHPSVEPLQWCVLLLAPRANLLAASDHARNFAVIVIVTIMVAALAFCVTLGLVIARPLRRLVHGMTALQQYDFGNTQQGGTSIFSELSGAQSSFASLAGFLRVFHHYISPAVTKGLNAGIIKQELSLNVMDVTVAFMDLEDFITICQKSDPSEAVAVASQAFDMCCVMVAAAEGAVDKFLGDCMMAVWGAPEPVDHPVVKGMRCALSIQHSLRASPLLLSCGECISLRIGLHGGWCLVGNFGSSQHWHYTAIGEVINVAARLQQLNHQCGTQTLATQFIYDQLHAFPGLQRWMRPLGNAQLFGMQSEISIFEVMDAPHQANAGWLQAIEQCRTGEIQQAAYYFASVYSSTADPVAYRLLDEILESKVRGEDGPFVRHMKGGWAGHLWDSVDLLQGLYFKI